MVTDRVVTDRVVTDRGQCANPECGKIVLTDSLWLGYCSDVCAWGHDERKENNENVLETAVARSVN